MKPLNSIALLAALALTTAFSLLTPGRASANEWGEAIRLTHKLEKHSETLRGLFQRHFRFSYHYVGIMGQLNRIDSGIEHIHGLAHDAYTSPGHLQNDVGTIDNAVHQLHDLVDKVDSGRSTRHVEGNTKNVHRQLDNMTRTLHSLEDLSRVMVRKEEQRQRELALQRQRELEARRNRYRGGHHSHRDPHGHYSGSQPSDGYGTRPEPSREQWNPFSRWGNRGEHQPSDSRHSGGNRWGQPQQPSSHTPRPTGYGSPRYTPARPAPSTRREPGATPEQFLRHAFGIFR